MSTIINNAKLGFLLSLFTSFIWGSLPIALKEIMQSLDAPTLVWCRFFIAFSILLPIVLLKKNLPFQKIQKNPKLLILLFILTLGIVGNFLLFSQALIYTTPTVVQVVIQLSSVGLLFSSVIIFNEHLSRIQLFGVIILIMGLLLFFNRNLIEMLTSLNSYSIGVGLTILSAISWIFFALTQKIALRTFNPLQILIFLNTLGLIILLPFAKFSAVFTLSTLQLALLLYSGICTVLSYASLAEAMRIWEVSKVSTIITLTPIFTLLFSLIFSILWPNVFMNPNLNLLSYISVFIVVFGAIFMVVGETILRPLIIKYLNK